MVEKAYSQEAIDFANFLVDGGILSEVFKKEDARKKGRGMFELFGDIGELLERTEMKKMPGLMERQSAIAYLIEAGILKQEKGVYYSL